MTKQQVCQLVDGLWVSKAQRHALKYKIQMRTFTLPELAQWGQRFQKAVDMQQELVIQHAKGAVQCPEVEELRNDFKGSALRRKRRTEAGKQLRRVVREQHGLSVPADLSRDAVDRYL